MIAEGGTGDELHRMPPLARGEVRRAGTRRNGRARRSALALGVLACAVCGFERPVSTQAPSPADVVLVLDTSASMSRNDPSRAVPSALAGLVDRLAGDDAAGLVLFGGRATATRPLAPLSTDTGREGLLGEIASIRYDERYTDIAAGVERALYELRTRGRPGARPVLVFLTDGIIDTGSAARDAERAAWLTDELLEDARRLGVKIYAVAFSEQADFMLIRRMAASTGGEYYRATSPGEVGPVFATVASRLEQSRAADPPAAPAPRDASERRSPPDAALAWVAAGLAAAGLAGVVLIAVAMRLRWAQAPGGAPAAGAPPAAPAGPRPSERETAPPLGTALLDFRTGAHLPITRARLTIGRDVRNDVVLPSDMVSGSHARIDFSGGRFFVVDLQSTNGTFVNGRRISEPTVVESGDRIDFDEFRFQLVDASERVKGTVVRFAPVQKAGLEAEPARPGSELDGSTPPESRHEAIENRAATHRLVSCFVHRGRRAIERCSRCRRAGCETCVTVTDEGPLCEECAATPSSERRG